MEEEKSMVEVEQDSVPETSSVQRQDHVNTESLSEILVDQAHSAAATVLIKESDQIKEEIMLGAESVIHNKTQAIKYNAEKEAKKALFESNKGACGCFGFEEETTERWAVNYMKIWNRIVTLLWLIIGSVTFAPVLFISGKLKAIVKRAWIAVILALLIYGAIVLSPYIITRVRGMFI